ncbi:hypothetical protein Rleg10DRAFT_5778 [Rhizobium leguminosarum bv. trifolii WSM2012]|nr:hypothetical protein Rleg10DRAFT_4208 [Rhizobium leguminosarum bv. trifolii WSM2012]EJC77084.1 hypothetical protein Rleg10DRAFT_5778 [Rhizobium leguminosarum bv. trifolii WSM2012]
MGIYETPVEMVARHILEGERHLAGQIALLERLRRKGLPTEVAEELLERFYLSQAQHEEHRRRISEECELGLRDKQGNLIRWQNR